MRFARVPSCCTYNAHTCTYVSTRGKNHWGNPNDQMLLVPPAPGAPPLRLVAADGCRVERGHDEVVHGRAAHC